MSATYQTTRTEVVNGFHVDCEIGVVFDPINGCVINPYSSGTNSKPTQRALQRCLDRCGNNIYHDFRVAAYNSVTISGTIPGLQVEEFSMCCSCKSFCYRNVAGARSHLRGCATLHKRSIPCKGYCFYSGQQLRYIVIQVGTSARSDDFAPGAVETVTYPLSPMPQLKSGDAQQEVTRADQLKACPHLNESKIIRFVHKWNSLKEENPLVSLMDFREQWSHQSSLVKLANDIYEHALKYHKDRRHCFVTDSRVSEHSTATKDPPFWLNEVTDSTQKAYVSVFKQWMCNMCGLMNSPFVMEKVNSNADLSNHLNVLYSAATTGLYDKTEVTIALAKATRIMMADPGNEELYLESCGLLLVGLAPKDESEGCNQFVVTDLLKTSLQARRMDAVVNFTKLLISSSFDDDTENETFQHFINTSRQSLPRFETLLHIRDLSKQCKESGRLPLNVIQDSDNGIRCGTLLFREEYLPTLVQNGISSFKEDLNRLCRKYPSLEFPDVDKVWQYILRNGKEDVMESGSGFSMFSSLAGDFQLTTFPKTLIDDARQNVWKTVKEFQSIAIDNIFPLLLISVFGPARGSEYARATWSNTRILSRSLFKDGMFMMAGSKTRTSQNKPNARVRIVPTPILKLIAYYIYIIRQIEKRLLMVGGVQITSGLEHHDEEQEESQGEDDDCIDDIDKDGESSVPLHSPTIGDMLDTYIFLYGDAILSSTKRTAIIRNFISRNIPFKGKHHVSGMTGRILRHVLIHYNRLIITKDSQTDSLIQFMDPIELSGNHSVQTGLSTYAKTAEVNYAILALANCWTRFLFESPQALVDQVAFKYHIDNSINTKDSYQLRAVGTMLYGKDFDYLSDKQCSITETSYFTNQSILVNLKTGFGKTIASLLPAAADALHFKHRHNPNHPDYKNALNCSVHTKKMYGEIKLLGRIKLLVKAV